MIRRKKYPDEFKRGLGLEIASKVSSIAEVSKREGISAGTLHKWTSEVNTLSTTSNEKEHIELLKKVRDLEELVSDQAVQIHILKKTQKIMGQLKRQERLSGSISPDTLGSKIVAKP